MPITKQGYRRIIYFLFIYFFFLWAGKIYPYLVKNGLKIQLEQTVEQKKKNDKLNASCLTHIVITEPTILFLSIQ